MAYDTKAALQSALNYLVLTNDAKIAYKMIAKMLTVDGVDVPSFEDARKEINEDN